MVLVVSSSRQVLHNTAIVGCSLAVLSIDGAYWFLGSDSFDDVEPSPPLVRMGPLPFFGNGSSWFAGGTYSDPYGVDQTAMLLRAMKPRYELDIKGEEEPTA